ncbi:MAG TPA: nitronate monooxygenase [Nonomuraea sp.]|nr:nitronate monooxygenase [Nonomuraea sp.]
MREDGLKGLRIPIVQAPMAGGPSTPALVREVGAAGGMGFLAAGYKTAEAMRQEIAEVRRTSAAPFGVNLFVPQPCESEPGALDAYRDELQAEADRYGVSLPQPEGGDDDAWDAKIAVLLADPVPVVSFTFGLPSRAVAGDLHRAGSLLVATVTSEAEARAATALGMDALCVQGPDAGGHRGTHDPRAEPGTTPLTALLTAIRNLTPVPLIAAGGLTTPDSIAEAITAGASAVQLGTAYLRTPESGAKPAHKDALADPRFTTTTLTRAFSGRYARGLRNRFIEDHDPTAPAAYPQVNRLTSPIRAAAAAAGDQDGMALWAGTGFQQATAEPAALVTERLWHQVAGRL